MGIYSNLSGKCSRYIVSSKKGMLKKKTGSCADLDRTTASAHAWKLCINIRNFSKEVRSALIRLAQAELDIRLSLHEVTTDENQI